MLAALLLIAPARLRAQVPDTTARRLPPADTTTGRRPVPDTVVKRSPGDTVAVDSATRQVVPASTAPRATKIELSGLVFGNFAFQPTATDAQQPGQVDNAFTVERAYLTFRGSSGGAASVRITADIYQTTEATPNAYTMRAKYAYLQFDGSRFANGANVLGRIGIVQNVLFESQEAFWPRYLSQVATERAGYFASSDAGVASLVTLPAKLGEVYATIVNGPGYTARERDRFKDYAIRLSLTPLAGRAGSPLLQGITLTAWGYRGAVSGKFVNGGAGQVGTVGSALDRSRAGIFVGTHDPRLAIAAELAQRHDDTELGANTVASPRVVAATTGRLASAYLVTRPLGFFSADGESSVGLVARYDKVSPTARSEKVVPEPARSNSYHNVIGGVFWELSPRTQLALDYQESLATNNGTSAAPPAPMKGYFLHFNASF